MTQESLTVREVCEALGVSRAMVQKLEASGQLKRARDGGRVVFDRAEVEGLAYAREVAKAQRVQDAQQREVQNGEAQAHREAVEFDAWSKISEAEDAQLRLEQARDGMRSQLDQIRRQLQELQDAERKRQHEASLAALAHQGERRHGIDFEFVDLLTMLAPVATVAAVAFMAREPAKGGKPSAAEGLQPERQNAALSADGAPLRPSKVAGIGPSLPARGRGDSSEGTFGEGLTTRIQAQPEHGYVAERSILEKVAAGTAGKEDLLALGTLLWRRHHPDGSD
jgi:excisionase family DNA binding protein